MHFHQIVQSTIGLSHYGCCTTARFLWNRVPPVHLSGPLSTPEQNSGSQTGQPDFLGRHRAETKSDRFVQVHLTKHRQWVLKVSAVTKLRQRVREIAIFEIRQRSFHSK